MAKTPNYPELVEQAERSVQGVKDPELKRIAFQKILEELLGGRTSTESRPRKVPRTSLASKRKTPPIWSDELSSRDARRGVLQEARSNNGREDRT